jgi:hypothetical protein
VLGIKRLAVIVPFLGYKEDAISMLVMVQPD